MVLSYNESPYKELMEAQQETFDSLYSEDVRTVYYHGGIPENYPGCQNFPVAINSMQLGFKITDEYYRMGGKFKEALDFIKDWNYEYIFRTNSSSYINKERLKEACVNLPKEKLYSGWTFTDSEDFGGACVSGAGMWLSKDTAEILRTAIDPEFEMEEDVYCGRILRKHGIKAIDERTRFDVGAVVSGVPIDRYHYRLKNPNRNTDIENMKILHKLIHG